MTRTQHTWLDSYPYAAISAFALHPLYLNLDQLAAGKKRNLPKALEIERKRLNAQDAVDYEAVMSAKLKFVRQIFTKQKEEILHRPPINIFLNKIGTGSRRMPRSAPCATSSAPRIP